MEISKIAKEIHANARNKGFYDCEFNFGEKIALICSEACEALEADRKGEDGDLGGFCQRYDSLVKSTNGGEISREYEDEIFKKTFERYVKNSVGDELADIIIRVLDLAEAKNIPIEDHIALKMRYNSMRPHKHGKAY